MGTEWAGRTFSAVAAHFVIPWLASALAGATCVARPVAPLLALHTEGQYMIGRRVPRTLIWHCSNRASRGSRACPCSSIPAQTYTHACMHCTCTHAASQPASRPLACQPAHHAKTRRPKLATGKHNSCMGRLIYMPHLLHCTMSCEETSMCAHVTARPACLQGRAGSWDGRPAHSAQWPAGPQHAATQAQWGGVW